MLEGSKHREKVMKDETETLKKHLSKLMEKYGVRGATKVQITAPCKSGDNYLCSVYRVSVETTEKEGDKKYSFIAKRPPQDRERREIVHFDQMFAHELAFYKEIIPSFEQLLAKHGTNINLFPELHAVSCEYGDEILILEDLACTGYKMHHSKMLDLDHLRLALEYLGRFHAYSFALRVEDPDIIVKWRKLDEPLFRSDRPSNSIRPNQLCDVIAMALEDEDEHYRERFDRFAERLYDHMIDAVDGLAAEPYAVLNHGDAWTNNILFKYPAITKEEQLETEEKTRLKKNSPIGLKFLDFQLYRYSSPVLDIVYLLFCCSTAETRRQYYDELLENYYSSLSACLNDLGHDANKLFPRSVLSEHLERFGKFAAGMAIYVIHIFTEEKKESRGNVENEENNDGAEIEKKLDSTKLKARLQSDPTYKRRIVETFRELIDRNYI